MQNSSEEHHRSEHETGEIRSSSRVMQDETLSKISPPRLVSRLPRFGGKENKSSPNLLPPPPPKKGKKKSSIDRCRSRCGTKYCAGASGQRSQNLRDLVDRAPEKSRFLPRTVTSVQFGSAPVDLMAACSILSIGTKGARKARGTLFFFNSATMLL